MTKEQRRIADSERPTAVCARRSEGGCSGPINVSHPFGRRIQERWLWCWICKEHHTGELKSESIGRWIVLNQAGELDFAKYPKAANGADGWRQKKIHLNNFYANRK